MGRIIHIAPARPGGAAHWAKLAAAALVAVALGLALTDPDGGPPTAARPAAAAAPAQVPAQPPLAAVGTGPIAATAADVAPGPAPCPLQSMQLALPGAPVRTVCMDATVVQQTGSVRSYVVRAGDAQGWTLTIDMVERSVAGVSLQARDGRTFRCERPDCVGDVALSASGTAATGHITLRDLRLAGPGEAILHASLRVPSDEQVPGLACTGPSTTISAPSGAAHRFCGQGGAGVEIADDGQRHYRFQDHEGRTLAITIDAEQRVTRIAWGGHACQGRACSGASTSSTDPANDLAERSFFFGRTALFEQGAGTAAKPALILDGSLVVPAQ